MMEGDLILYDALCIRAHVHMGVRIILMDPDHVRCSGVMGLTKAQGAQPESFDNTCLRQMLGLHSGQEGPSTADILAPTSQTSMADLLMQHIVRWLKHATRSLMCHGPSSCYLHTPSRAILGPRGTLI